MQYDINFVRLEFLYGASNSIPWLLNLFFQIEFFLNKAFPLQKDNIIFIKSLIFCSGKNIKNSINFINPGWFPFFNFHIPFNYFYCISYSSRIPSLPNENLKTYNKILTEIDLNISKECFFPWRNFLYR